VDPLPPLAARDIARPSLHDGRRGIPAWKRRRAAYWLVATVLAGALGFGVVASLDAASARVDALGLTARVAVASRDLPLGTVVHATDLEWRDLPVGAVAPDAVTDRQPSIVGRTVVAHIGRGEPVSAIRLAPSPLEGLAARTPAAHHAVAIPVDARTPALVLGQHVDLFAADGPRDPVAAPIARAGIVVDLDDRRATIAVDDRDLAATTAALIDRTIVITVLGAT